VVSQERISGQVHAGAANAPVLGHTGTRCVSAVTADEPPVLVGGHRTELDTHPAIWAADGQDCVGRHWALLHRAKEAGTQDSRQSRPVISLKTKGSLGAMRVSNRQLRRDSGNGADRRAAQAGSRNAQPSSAPDEKTKAPQTPVRVAGRSFEQPSPEDCPQSPYALILTVGMDPVCYVSITSSMHVCHYDLWCAIR
jgi:hypothetical protein